MWAGQSCWSMHANSDANVSKRADLPYRPGHGDHWLKSKCLERQEFIILGYIPSTAASRSVGSLALGYHDNQKLVYAGRVGTGWSQEQARSLCDELETISVTKPSFANPLPAGAEKGVRWVEPRLVCDIEYRGWTSDRLLRAAAFKDTVRCVDGLESRLDRRGAEQP